MVALNQFKYADRKDIMLTRSEAIALVVAVTISVSEVEPPEETGLLLERVMNRVLDAFDMEYSSCPEHGIQIDGDTVARFVARDDESEDE